MSHAAAKPQKQRRRLALVLLATTAAAALLGGCGQTDGLFSKLGASSSDEVQLSSIDAVDAVAQWSAAYNKNPQDPKMAIGYAMALKAIGSRDRALEVLTVAYRADQTNGAIAAELGRLALDMGRLDIAAQTLNMAETQGVRDWKTLSAQGTLRAKQGKQAEAQQYYLAALQEQPDAVSVINNLALSYALDGKPAKSEELLRKAVASGHEDKRVRQNLALVLGLQGKFDEARQVASADISTQDAKANTSYLRNMLSNATQLAVANPGSDDAADDDWEPFASNNAVSTKAPATTAPGTTEAASPGPVKPGKMASTPTLPASANVKQVQVVAATASVAQESPGNLLRTNRE